MLEIIEDVLLVLVVIWYCFDIFKLKNDLNELMLVVISIEKGRENNA